jgi:hypothetical protein
VRIVGRWTARTAARTAELREGNAWSRSTFRPRCRRGTPTRSPDDGGRRRAVIAAGALTGLLIAASFVLIGPLDVRLGTGPALAQRVIASLLGGAGILSGLRAFRVAQQSFPRRAGTLFLSFGGSILLWWMYIERVGVRAAILSVFVAIVASTALFVGANRWLDQVLVAWWRFTTVTGLALGALIGLILVGNRSIGLFTGVVGIRTDRSILLVPVLALLGAVYGLLIGRTAGRDPAHREHRWRRRARSGRRHVLPCRRAPVARGRAPGRRPARRSRDRCGARARPRSRCPAQCADRCGARVVDRCLRVPRTRRGDERAEGCIASDRARCARRDAWLGLAPVRDVIVTGCVWRARVRVLSSSSRPHSSSSRPR